MNLKTFLRTFASHTLNIIRNQISNVPDLQANIKYKNIHKNESCFILGSGNSIKNHNLKLLQDKIVITQNNFHSHEDIKTIKPTYHCVVPMYQSKECNNDWIEWFTSMERRLPYTKEFFLGLNAKAFVEKHNFFSFKRNYVQMGLYPLFMRKAFVDITKIIMHIPTSLTQCLIIALYMGFSKIYLVGFDLNQPCIPKRENVRFYSYSPILNNKDEKKIEKESRDTGEEWFYMWIIWKQLLLLRNYAESRKIQIYNVTEGGLLDCFERRSYESVL